MSNKEFVFLIYKYTDKASWLSTAKDFCELLLSIVAIIGGIIGLLYFTKLREKRLSASFSYMAQLRIHIENIKMLFVSSHDELLNELVCPTQRLLIVEFENSNYNEVINIFKNRVDQALVFLSCTKDQMPVYKGWTEKMTLFIHLLETFSFAFNTSGYIWKGSNDQIQKQKDDFYSVHERNLAEMIKDIEEYQKSNESKIVTKRPKASPEDKTIRVGIRKWFCKKIHNE